MLSLKTIWSTLKSMHMYICHILMFSLNGKEQHVPFPLQHFTHGMLVLDCHLEVNGDNISYTFTGRGQSQTTNEENPLLFQFLTSTLTTWYYPGPIAFTASDAIWDSLGTGSNEETREKLFNLMIISFINTWRAIVWFSRFLSEGHGVQMFPVLDIGHPNPKPCWCVRVSWSPLYLA